MAERDEMLVALVQEIMGPRGGPTEVLPANQDPRDEYITGVLAPARAQRHPDDIEADADELPLEDVEGEEDEDGPRHSLSSEEDQDPNGHMVVPPLLSPALNPKELPRSVGLSFTVEGDTDDPTIEVCATWARYQLVHAGWQRLPTCLLTGPVRANQHRTWSTADGVLLSMRVRNLAPHRWRVSLFLVNQTPIQRPNAATPEHIFQPQIRAACCDGTRVLPLRSGADRDPNEVQVPGSLAAEDASLELLYRGRTALARGHLCGATWRDIDPERPHPTIPSPTFAPFSWTDAGAVPATDRARFSPADVRTELVPCYPVAAPDMDWDSQSGPPPVLDPARLAETWQPADVRAGLQPLVDAYRAWIDGQRALIPGLEPVRQPVASRHINECSRAADRIQEAIDLLAADDEVRLAFAFANKAISMQSGWRGQPISWRPFQLAFILLNLPALADRDHADRAVCDLLWFPTGGGKTEAYLALTAFTLAFRRLRARHNPAGEDRTGAGTAVLSRYTLRLLTIQQFRRALGVVTACEMLRVQNLDSATGLVGWRPAACAIQDAFLWGGHRFSAGLYVGGDVTPNNLLSIGPIPGPTGFTLYVGALDMLQGADRTYNGPNTALQTKIRSSRNLEMGGEPAQVLTCPVCGSHLAVPDEGFGPGQQALHLVYQGGRTAAPGFAALHHPRATVDAVNITRHTASDFSTLSLTFTVPGGARLSARDVDEWWYQTISPALGQNVEFAAARPARPGYVILSYSTSQRTVQQADFDIYCPNPGCDLNQHAWAEQVPVSRATRTDAATGNGQLTFGTMANGNTAALPAVANLQWQEVPEAFRRGPTRWVSGRIPIPALTVDEQAFHRCPSLVIATVDKFARLAFEPRSSALFGNVDHYHSRTGYYREGCPPAGTGNPPAAYRPHPPGISGTNTLRVRVPRFAPPDLILQDELHLIEGPLGSMVGLYETAIDLLCQRTHNGHTVIPKYLASTATVRQADSQVQSLFDRRLAQFPPSGLSADDRFFARDTEIHLLESARPGRLYVGVCAPGKGPLTPTVRIWSSLLQTGYDLWTRYGSSASDHLYTLAGYFNAIRELAGVVSLYRQDIPERLDFRYGAEARPLPPDRYMELSSRASSLDLPALLERLQIVAPDALDALFATSMFGTGMDVGRLGLMVVQGQPKATAQYIQATGRVGRMDGALVVAFLRASRPRDLDHYEFFTGYHRALYRHVEPVTVAPFSPRARERAIGPVAVALLRQAADIAGIPVPREWAVQQRLSGSVWHSGAPRMDGARYDPEVRAIPDVLEARAATQPDGRRPAAGVTAQEASSELDLWHSVASRIPDPNRFVYNEPALTRTPERNVVLGDDQHRQAPNLEQVYENAPQSLRDVESTTGFRS